MYQAKLEKNVSLTEEQKEKIRWTLLTRQAVAKLLKVCVHTVDNYRRTKGLPFVKIGNSVRFSIPEIQAWLMEQRLQAIEKNGEMY